LSRAEKRFAPSSSIVTSRSRDYKDIDLSFEVKPGPSGLTLSGDVYKKVDIPAVFQAVKNLLLTNRYEKPFQPEFGGNLSSLLFENITEFTSNDIRNMINSAVRAYEPRVEVLAITTKYGDSYPNNTRFFEGKISNATVGDDYNVYIEVVFKIINTEDTFTFNTTLNRLR
jgi:phage baseplate assembly protein W